MGRGIRITDLHRKVFGYLARGDPLAFIIYSTRLKKANFYKKLHTLEKYGYLKITRVGKILDIQLQPSAVKELTMLSGSALKLEYIRLHNLWISCPILRKPRTWDTDFVEKILEERSIKYTRHSPKNWKGLFFNYASVKVRITPNKVMINPPWIEIPSRDDPENAKNMILGFLEDVLPKIENLFKIQVRKPHKVSMTVSSQHIAFVENQIAKYFLERDIGLRVYDSKGRLRVLVDKSHGKAELEMVNKAYAEEDSSLMDDLIQDTVLGDFKPREIKADLEKAAGLIKDLATNQGLFSKDMVEYGQKISAHTKSIEQLGSGVEKMTSILERLERKI